MTSALAVTSAVVLDDMAQLQAQYEILETNEAFKSYEAKVQEALDLAIDLGIDLGDFPYDTSSGSDKLDALRTEIYNRRNTLKETVPLFAEFMEMRDKFFKDAAEEEV